MYIYIISICISISYIDVYLCLYLYLYLSSILEEDRLFCASSSHDAQSVRRNLEKDGILVLEFILP